MSTKLCALCKFLNINEDGELICSKTQYVMQHENELACEEYVEDEMSYM